MCAVCDATARHPHGSTQTSRPSARWEVRGLQLRHEFFWPRPARLRPGCVPNIESIDVSEGIGQVSLSADGRFAVDLWARLSQPLGLRLQLPEGQVFVAETCAGIASGCTPNPRSITPTVRAARWGRDTTRRTSPSRQSGWTLRHIQLETEAIFGSTTCQRRHRAWLPSKTMVPVASDGSPGPPHSPGPLLVRATCRSSSPQGILYEALWQPESDRLHSRYCGPV